ncbi:Autophagy-related protein [Actinidia chinensis var. chinensis]|uniref:Autophagy-related protein n=1 Tax=Actinidia chinensis var. chinensis TaxID=1590841 RepID=A0A2R6QW34_ACTCC|nr:Autophagy-related protein [Actinidia chinensis var. chinensis]
MRNIATCYSEHAIKVSDSYCSGPSSSSQSYLSPTLIPPIQDSVTCLYTAKLSTKKHLLISLTWSNPQTLALTITIPNDPFKFTTKPHQFRTPKGTKKIESPNSKIEIHWDLSAAKFDSGPEPVTGFFLLVVVDSELTLRLGDAHNGVVPDVEIANVPGVKIAKSALLSRREQFFGSGLYSCRAKFCDTGTWHDVSVKFNGGENLELGVWIDRKNVVMIKRLQWNFRGNQTIFVDGVVVDLMWDVHDWFFSNNSVVSGCYCGGAVFLFRTRSGYDSRLWLEEKNLEQKDERIGFSLLICACKSPPD